MRPINIAIDIANLSKLFLALIDGMTEEQKETTPAPTVVGDVDSVMLVMADGITYDARRFTGDLDSALINTIAH